MEPLEERIVVMQAHLKAMDDRANEMIQIGENARAEALAILEGIEKAQGIVSALKETLRGMAGEGERIVAEAKRAKERIEAYREELKQ